MTTYKTGSNTIATFSPKLQRVSRIWNWLHTKRVWDCYLVRKVQQRAWDCQSLSGKLKIIRD